MHRRGFDLSKPHASVDTGRSTLRFYRADCLDVLEALPPASVSIVVTSPPYNLGIDYRSYDDTVPREQYLEWSGRWIGAAGRTLEPDGSLFLNVGGKPTDPWTALDIAQTARPHLELQNTIHWVKSIAIDRRAALADAPPALPQPRRLLRESREDVLSVGHYKPINSPRFLNDCHEFVFHFTPRGRTPLDRTAIGVPYQDASNIARWRAGSRNVRCRGNTWFIPYETIQSRDADRPHPATFPPRLPEYCCRLHGLPRVKLAMDPFLGLGASAVAAARLGLNFIGVELDPHYLKEAIARVRAAVAAGSAAG